MFRFACARPTAFLPVAMSLAALGLVLGHFALYGIVHETDEGTPAHLFQILMLLQVPLIAAFAFRWIPTEPKRALGVLGVQVLSGLAAFASVYFLT